MSKIFLDRRALLVAGASSALLSACGGLIGPPEAPPLYLLKPAPRAGGGPRVTWQLSITLPEAPDSLDTNRIALIQPDGTMDFYANALWQDRISLLVQSALVDAFESSGRIAAVGRDTEGLKSDYLLETDIRDFEARYDAPDGIPTAQVRVESKLVTVRGRAIATAHNAHAEVAASANTVPAVVVALNQALDDTLGQIVTWALDAPMPTRPE
jgi:cholesterol transport system auxiliary component